MFYSWRPRFSLLFRFIQNMKNEKQGHVFNWAFHHDFSLTKIVSPAIILLKNKK